MRTPNQNVGGRVPPIIAAPAMYVCGGVLCCRGSSEKSGGDGAKPNDYQRNTADSQKKKKSQKKSQTKDKKKKSQKKNADEERADQDDNFPEPPDIVGNDDPMSYEFQETNTNQFAPYDLDEQFYPSESVYGNDPQFQPQFMGYAD